MDTEQMLQAELEPDECLIWSATGDAGRRAIEQAHPILTAVIFVICLCAYGVSQVWNGGSKIEVGSPGWQRATAMRLQFLSQVAAYNGFIALIALALGAVALYRYRYSTRVCYGITDRRLVILGVSGRTRKTESFSAHDL